MIRLRDIAERAGVSVSTVSNVVNGRTRTVNADILRRVQESIAALGYQPNRAARFLKTGHTPLLGLLVPSVATPTWGLLARSVEIVAQSEFGFRILVGNTDRDPQKEMSFLGDLWSHGIRGVIIVSPLLQQSHFKDSIQRGLVAVCYDQCPAPGQPLDVDYVSIDHREAIGIAVNHLIDQGHRRLAFATASGKSVSRQDKIDGFLAASAAAGLAASAEIIEGQASTTYGDDEMLQLGRDIADQIARRALRPTGVVALNDMLATGLILGFQHHGLRVPEDISVVGMDDLPIAAFIPPAISSVRSPIKEMARKMVGRIVKRLNNPNVELGKFIYSPQLVARGSVAEPNPALLAQRS